MLLDERRIFSTELSAPSAARARDAASAASHRRSSGLARRARRRRVRRLRGDPHQQLRRDGEHPLLRQARRLPAREQLADERARAAAVAAEHELPELRLLREGILGRPVRRAGRSARAARARGRSFHGLEQIVRHAGADAGAHVLENVKSPSAPALRSSGIRALPRPRAQPAHHRHLQVRNEDVARRAAQQRQRVAAVARLAREPRARARPSRSFFSVPRDEPLVIDEHHAKRSFHLPPPLWEPGPHNSPMSPPSPVSTGTVNEMHVPCPGAL